jgi:hypothetical protein
LAETFGQIRIDIDARHGSTPLLFAGQTRALGFTIRDEPNGGIVSHFGSGTVKHHAPRL